MRHSLSDVTRFFFWRKPVPIFVHTLRHTGSPASRADQKITNTPSSRSQDFDRCNSFRHELVFAAAVRSAMTGLPPVAWLLSPPVSSCSLG